MLRAEPTSSAHTLVVASAGVPHSILNISTIGFIPNRNKTELAGQPVLTPPRIQKRSEPSPTPDEKVVTLHPPFGKTGELAELEEPGTTTGVAK